MFYFSIVQIMCNSMWGTFKLVNPKHETRLRLVRSSWFNFHAIFNILTENTCLAQVCSADVCRHENSLYWLTKHGLKLLPLKLLISCWITASELKSTMDAGTRLDLRQTNCRSRVENKQL